MIEFICKGDALPSRAKNWETALTLWFMRQIPFRPVERIECGEVVAERGAALPADIVTAAIAAVERSYCSVPDRIETLEGVEAQAEALVRYLAELRELALVDDEPEDPYDLFEGEGTFQ